jgi:hypothetical protein
LAAGGQAQYRTRWLREAIPRAAWFSANRPTTCEKFAAGTDPAEMLYPHFGITPEAIVAEARRLLAIQPETTTA